MSDADRRDGDAWPVTVAAGPAVRGDQIVFRVADPGRQLQEVRLCQELWRPRDGPAFSRVPTGDTWTLTLPRPPVDRMEYQLLLRREDTSTAVVCDPANPLRAPGAFGEKSVIEVHSRVLGCAIPGLLWSSPRLRPGAPAPLLPTGGVAAGVCAHLGVRGGGTRRARPGQTAAGDTHLQHRRGEPGQQPRRARRPAHARLPGAPRRGTRRAQWEDSTGALASTHAFASLLDGKAIPHEVDLWGHDVPHDWPSWRRQLAHHLPRLC